MWAPFTTDSFQRFMRGWKSLSDRRALLILRPSKRRNLYFQTFAIKRTHSGKYVNGFECRFEF